MQAVLNLSTLKINQKYLGKNGFNKIMSLTTLDIPKCLTREYARQTIVNLSRHPSNRTKIYKEELRLKAMYAHGKLKPCRDPEFVKRYNSFHSPVKVQERPNSLMQKFVIVLIVGMIRCSIKRKVVMIN